jgi:hypothetical protein
MPLKLTDTPPSVAGKGMALADVSPRPRLEPKMDTSEPGTTGPLKEAASTTPPGSTAERHQENEYPHARHAQGVPFTAAMHGSPQEKS